MEKFCNTSHPEPLTSTSNELTLHFHSDNDGNDMGFQIHYSTIGGIQGCGGTFSSVSGIDNVNDTYINELIYTYFFESLYIFM